MRDAVRFSGALCAAMAVLLVAGTAAPVRAAVDKVLGVDPAELSPAVSHPLLMLTTLKRAVYAGKERDPDTGRQAKIKLEMTVRDSAETMAGTKVTVSDITEYTDDEVAGKTRDYFAQHSSGAVYYLAERIDDLEDGKVIGHDGAWVAGEKGTPAGVFLPAAYKVGDAFEPRRAVGVSQERSKVVGVARTIKVPAGTFKDCIEIEVYDVIDKDSRRQWYCPGTGMVKESSVDRTIELVSRESR
jgi:hypothetical protein